MYKMKAEVQHQENNVRQDKRRVRRKRFVSCLLTVALTVSLLSFLTDLTESKSSDEKYAEFFTEENDFDVLLLGASHMVYGISPMELWDDYGITSYNIAAEATTIGTNYWTLRLALEYTQPQVVVIDCLNLTRNLKIDPAYSYIHTSMDAFPLSLTKIQAALDLLDDDVADQAIEDGTIEVSENRNLISILWDFSVYHTRWADLTKDDFQPPNNIEKGGQTLVNVAEATYYDEVPDEEKMEEETASVVYLKKIIELCQEKGIEVVITYLPFSMSTYYQLETHRLYDIAEEYGIDYINFRTLDLVDYETDYYDDTHMNASGMKKCTEYLGAYLAERYDLTDHREDPAYAGWNEDYERFVEYKDGLIAKETSLDNYLMLMADESYDVTIEMDDDRAILKEDHYRSLLENLGIDLETLDEEGEVTVIEVESGKESISCLAADGPDTETETIADQSEQETQANEEICVTLTVTSHDTGELVDEARFDENGERITKVRYAE